MKIDGTRFATIEYQAEDVVTFPEGLIGFPDYRNYVLVCTKDGSPFRWLQSVEEPALAFLVADPAHYVPDYSPEVPAAVVKALALDEKTPRLVYATAAIPPGNPTGLTLNLAAPLIINAESREALQVVVEDPAYTMRYKVFHKADQAAA